MKSRLMRSKPASRAQWKPLLRLFGAVDAVERLEFVVVEGLDAEGEAIDPGGDEAGGGRGGRRYPGLASSETSAPGSRSNASRRAAMMRLDLLDREEGRRAAPEEDVGDSALTGYGGPEADLVDESGVVRADEVVETGVGVEVAVGALERAEGGCGR